MQTTTPKSSSLSKKLVRFVLLFLLLLLTAGLVMAFLPLPAATTQIDFTRYLHVANPITQVVQTSDAVARRAGADQVFVAQAGPGRLLIAADCLAARPSVVLNGASIALPAAVEQITDDRLAIPVTLLTSNFIKVNLSLQESACSDLRIKQSVSVTTHALSRVHFNTNVSDFEAAREFYGAIGFSTVSGFPDTNTQAMARAIGIATPTSYDGSQGDHAGGYLLHGELVGPGGFAGGVIDLIEFTIPRSLEPPYASLNHLGMARAVMHTNDVEASWQAMSKLGVEFVSAPVVTADGSGFAIFRDPDGTSYELRQTQASQSALDIEPESVGITRLGAVNINVSDLERSAAWYQMLGFERHAETLPSPSVETARGFGFADPIRLVGEAVRHRIDRSALELVQWLEPFDARPPYALPVNHLGIHRMAFSTSDIEADVESLIAQGVPMVSAITPCCSGDDSWGRIVAFMDPDGTVLELVEQPMMTPIVTLSVRLNRLSGALANR